MVVLLDNKAAHLAALVLFLPATVLARMRGVVSEAEELFPTNRRQLMGDMGGGDCPSADVSAFFPLEKNEWFYMSSRLFVDSLILN